MKPSKPSKNEMDRISALWEKEPSYMHYKYEVSALEWLFKSYPNNTNLNEIIIKVACLDRLYSTNITKSYKIPQVAQKILESGFDDRVQKGDITLVDDIASLGKTQIEGQGGKQILSFASKYCVWHNDCIYKKDDFVIIDSIVKTKLKEFNEQYPFAKFSKKDFKDYKKYKEILEKFREFFGLECSFRDIDRYLWRLGKLEQMAKTKQS